MTSEELAGLFHETYERLAPKMGYRTREESAKPWAEVPETNKALMTAVCAEILEHLRAQSRFEENPKKWADSKEAKARQALRALVEGWRDDFAVVRYEVLDAFEEIARGEARP